MRRLWLRMVALRLRGGLRVYVRRRKQNEGEPTVTLTPAIPYLNLPQLAKHLDQIQSTQVI
jgi:hypothetical protein